MATQKIEQKTSRYQEMLIEALDSLDMADKFNYKGWVARTIYEQGFVIQMPGTNVFDHVTYARHWRRDSSLTVEKHFGNIFKPTALISRDHRTRDYRFTRSTQEPNKDFAEAIEHIHEMTDKLRIKQESDEE